MEQSTVTGDLSLFRGTAVNPVALRASALPEPPDLTGDLGLCNLLVPSAMPLGPVALALSLSFDGTCKDIPCYHWLQLP